MSTKYSHSILVGIFILVTLSTAACASRRLSASTPTIFPTLSPTETATATATETAAPTPTPTEIATATTALSESSTSQELFAAKQGEIPAVFTFGGHEWKAAENQNGEKVWTREDGKVNLEWVDDLYGGHHPSYMFVTRSEKKEGKRNLEIYSDPRYPVFENVIGEPSQVDTFIQKLANVIQGNAAHTALAKNGTTLKLIIGYTDYWPIGNDSGKPQTIYYDGSNGEKLSQKIWGYEFSDGDIDEGVLGPFVNSANAAVGVPSLLTMVIHNRHYRTVKTTLMYGSGI